MQIRWKNETKLGLKSLTRCMWRERERKEQNCSNWNDWITSNNNISDHFIDYLFHFVKVFIRVWCCFDERFCCCCCFIFWWHWMLHAKCYIILMRKLKMRWKSLNLWHVKTMCRFHFSFDFIFLPFFLLLSHLTYIK